MRVFADADFAGEAKQSRSTLAPMALYEGSDHRQRHRHSHGYPGPVLLHHHAERQREQNEGYRLDVLDEVISHDVEKKGVS